MYWGTGWMVVGVCRTIDESKITSSGRAEAMIVGKHVTITRLAHEVTAAALYALQRAAHGKYTIAHTSGVNVLPCDGWYVTSSPPISVLG